MNGAGKGAGEDQYSNKLQVNQYETFNECTAFEAERLIVSFWEGKKQKKSLQRGFSLEIFIWI